MIEPTSNLTPMPSGPASSTAPSGAAGGFVLALGAFLDASIPVPAAPFPGGAARQDDAAGGKSLPDDGAAADDDSDGADNAASIWLPPQVPFAALPAVAYVPIPATRDAQSASRDVVATPAPTALPTEVPFADPRVAPVAASIVTQQSSEAAVGNRAMQVSGTPFPSQPLPPFDLPPVVTVAPVPVAAPAVVAIAAFDPVSTQNTSQSPGAPPREQAPPLAGLRGVSSYQLSSATPARRLSDATVVDVPYQRLADARQPTATTRSPRNAAALVAPASVPVAMPVEADSNVRVPRASPALVTNIPNAAANTSVDEAAVRVEASPRTTIASPADSVAPQVIVRPAPLTVGSVQPARQAFAGALSALSSPRRPRGQGLADADTLNPVPREATSQTLSSITASAPAQTHDAPLDLRQDRGLARMLDHIERLRDDANASDTRIRLVPDALGTVDVAVRKDGDAVHVRFSAASEATRAAIADAQPRLADMAETRGVKIAGSSIDAGTGGDARPQSQARPDPTRPIPAAPRSTVVADADSTNDQRLA